MLIAGAVLCASIGFAVGHYTAGHEPFYYIGTPIELGATNIATPANDAPLPRLAEPLLQSEQSTITRAAEGLCGARTKSGKPCRRRVKGGGYCWQHRESQ